MTLDSLRDRVSRATASAGVGEFADALLGEIVAAGGVAFVTREHLADSGIPRSSRALVLDALSDSDEVLVARARLRALAEHLPASLAPSILFACEDLDPARRGEHCVFAFGAILRHVVAYLLGPRVEEGVGIADVLRLLSRPSYGQMWSAARTLARHASLSETPLATRVARLERVAAPHGLGEGTLISRMLALRNSVAHGSRALAGHEWRAREGTLLACLVTLLEHLAMSRDERMEPCLWDEGPDGQTGVLEGWDERRGGLNFVGSHSSWHVEDARRWERWRDVLERAGVATVPLARLDVSMLASRAGLSRPAWCALGVDLPLRLSDLIDVASLEAGVEPTRIYARDPSLMVALCVRHAESEGAHALVLHGSACDDAPPAIVLSETLGLSPGLSDEDPTVEAAAALMGLRVVLLDPDPERLARWRTMIGQVPGIRVWAVLRGDGEGSTPEMGHLARPVYEAARARYAMTALPRWERLSVDVQSGRWTLARIWSFVTRPDLMPRPGLGPIEAQYHLLRRACSELGLGRAAELLSHALHERTIDERTDLFEALVPLDMLGTRSGRLGFADDDSEWAAELFVLRHGTHRVVREMLSRMRPAAELETARMRRSALTARGFTCAPAGLRVEWFALHAAEGHPLPDGYDPDDALEVARALARWSLPVRAGVVLEALAANSPIHAGRAALMARSCADFASAERLLEALPAEPVFLHQLAGLLRDRKAPGDARRSARLYQDLLDRDDLPCDQRVWTQCGLAELLAHAGQRQRALELLHDAMMMATASCPELVPVVDHRVAFVHALALDWAAALPFAGRAADAVASREDAFTGRVLDTYSRILAGLDQVSAALSVAVRALRIKRLGADRRGTQMALLLISQLRQTSGEGDAISPAREALALAEFSNDEPGMAAAHSRLKTLLRRVDPSEAERHRVMAAELQAGQVERRSS